MTTLRNKTKLAAVTRETQEENPRNGQSRNTSVPRINEEYITQLSEEIEGRVSKKLSQEFNRIESRISDALSKLDEFLLNQQITTHSETVPGTFQNTNAENQGTNEDNSQRDPHPEAGIFCGQNAQNSDLEDCCDRKFSDNWIHNTFLVLFSKKLQKLITKHFNHAKSMLAPARRLVLLLNGSEPNYKWNYETLVAPPNHRFNFVTRLDFI